MSDLLCPKRLYWSHTRGFAKHDGVRVELTRLPRLAGLEAATEIDYAPGSIAQVRIGCDPVRDLTPDEILVINHVLDVMADSARAVL